MNFFRTVIERPVMTTMIVVVMLVMGMYSYNNLVTELIPSINFPVIVVTTIYPGAAPGEVETQVTK
nr:efflux RND transporter permease subunit [Candidatus Krumholzibacteria bacterium]